MPTKTRNADSPAGKWILAASVLGSGAVFLEGTVVSVAIPAIGRDLGLGIAGLQWVMNGYLLTLSALMLFGGALAEGGTSGRADRRASADGGWIADWRHRDASFHAGQARS